MLGSVGRLSYDRLWVSCCCRTLCQNFTGISPEFHQNFTGCSPEFAGVSQDFARISNWSTLEKGNNRNSAIPQLGDSKNNVRGYCLDIPRFEESLNNQKQLKHTYEEQSIWFEERMNLSPEIPEQRARETSSARQRMSGAPPRFITSGVHKGGLSKGGFSTLCVILSVLHNPPLLNPPLWTPEQGYYDY